MRLPAIFTRNVLIASLLLVIMAVTTSVSAIETVTELKIDNPREFGYFIGDIISRDVSFKAQKPWQLDVDSLPVIERSGLWLELLNLEIESFDAGSATEYHLRLTWQIIGIDNGKTIMELPEFDIRLIDDAVSRQLPVSALSISVLPILAEGESIPMPVQAPAAIGSENLKLLQWIAGAVFAISLLGFTIIRWLIPFLNKRRYPFAQACRELSNKSREMDYASSLAIAHRAFDQTASRALFNSNFPVLFEQAPWLRSLADPISRFYEKSDAYFFSGTSSEASAADLIKLCRSCRALERSQ